MEQLIRLLADGLLVPIGLLAVYVFMFRVNPHARMEIYARIVMAGMTAYLCAKLIGSVYQPSHERPFEMLGLEAGASYLNNPGFPSDHALFATFLAVSIWFASRSWRLTCVAIVLAVLMGAGRVIALVHTPLDVLGGMAIAVLGSLWYIDTTGKRNNEAGER